MRCTSVSILQRKHDFSFHSGAYSSTAFVTLVQLTIKSSDYIGFDEFKPKLGSHYIEWLPEINRSDI
ncbi:hypothetical protein GXM_03526 [Nostoc sphaeroides CCNUC1]|uniref:Uncharacterized protein n=1 Tax=Nostoc sphaeroides CCNUC1 TaxID=2653204 RepID=A0A5P8W1B4_9NOSO|nr:hypothetical protein GXM_03526 [Nostoc sphaeroides CCNUC1]